MSSVVAIGRRMKISEMFIGAGPIVRRSVVFRTSTLTPLASRYWPSVTTFSPIGHALSITSIPPLPCRHFDIDTMHRLVRADDIDI